MKKMVKAAGIGLVILSSSLFANAAEAAQKIGYVGTNYIIKQLPQRESIITDLQNELKDDRAELDKIGAAIKTKAQKIERDGALLGDEGIQKLKIEISSLQAEGKIKQEAFAKKAKGLEIKAKQEMMKLVQSAVDKVAEKEGYDIVVDGSMLVYATQDANLTEKVLAELK
ncbi:OmpH family outer membrane protein [Vibrio sp. JC009]|uniref:OmpH family outer membrane protein n=1 Tax=Vibrio sp. JC009 TaxID=2912314 RepID=UPI0023B18A1D|nr:OmpH family outer membrane protein [Vibrio sp. JC009]WED21175.1 OmpH family outer membrane protein [Vibrio sp. JC009]